MNKESANSLTRRIVIGMIAGIVLGAIFQWMLPKGGDLLIPLYLFDFSVKGFFVDGIFEIGGKILVFFTFKKSKKPRKIQKIQKIKIFYLVG